MGNYTVDWLASTGATRYKLDTRAGTSGAWTTTDMGAALTQSYTGQPGGTYQYRVKACIGQVNCSAYSATLTVTVAAAPSRPAKPVVEHGTTVGSYKVKWATTTGASKYKLQARKGTTSSWTTTDMGTGLSKSYTGLTHGTYQYQVAACASDTLCSAYSVKLTVWVPPAVPAKPTVSHGTAMGNYTVDWLASTGATRYKLDTRAGTSGAWTTTDMGAALTQSYTGQPGGTYQYRVKACIGQVNCSAYSATLTVTVAPDPPAEAPTLSGPSTSNGEHTLSWGAVTGASDYTVRERQGSGSWTEYSVSATSETFSGRSSGSWSYQAQACNGGGCSDWSNTVTVTVTGVSVSISPSPSPDGQYTVSWTAPAYGNTVKLYEKAPGGSYTLAGTYALTTTSQDFDKDTAGAYWYKTERCQGGYWGIWNCQPMGNAASVMVTLADPPGGTDPPDAPLPPTLATGTGELTASWAAPADNGSALLEYRLRYKRMFSFTLGISWSIPLLWTQTDAVDSATTSLALSGLTNGLTYQAQAQARNAGGWSAWSGSATGVPLAAPVISESSSSLGQYTLSWVAISGATVYEIREREGDEDAGNPWTTHLLGAATSRSFTKPENGLWSYQARACNSGGCGDWSDTHEVTVQTTFITIDPSPSLDGDYTVSWSALAGVSVKLFEKAPGGTWSEIGEYNATQREESFVGKAPGTYEYKLSVCYGSVTGLFGYECAQLGGSASVEVLPPVWLRWDPNPVDYDGDATLTWSSLNATSCSLTVGDDLVLTDLSGTRVEPNVTADILATLSCDINGDTETASDTLTVDPTTIPTSPMSLEWDPNPVDYGGDSTLTWSLPMNATDCSLTVGGQTLTDLSGDYEATNVAADIPATLSCEVPGETDTQTKTEELTANLVVRPLPPDKPTATAPDASGGYTVSWTSVALATSYRLEAYHVPADAGTLHTLGNVFSKAFASPAAGVWRYRAQACIDADDSDLDGTTVCSVWSEALTVGPPDAPAAPALTSGDEALTVDWEAPAENNSEITAYSVGHRQADSEAAWDLVAVDGTDLTLEIESLTNGVEYEVRVRAANGYGDSDWSPVARGVPGERLPAPKGLRGPAGSLGSHTLHWGPVIGAVRYELAARQGEESDPEEQDDTAWTVYDTGAATRKAFSALAHGNWRYRARACAGPTPETCGDWSDVLEVVVGYGSVPGAPAPARRVTTLPCRCRRARPGRPRRWGCSTTASAATACWGWVGRCRGSRPSPAAGRPMLRTAPRAR